jgi:flavin reductase (DIM6/NTAB) family NADH-FMN oxidoreductase RutF
MQHQKIREPSVAALDAGELRRTLGSFATGVAVATTLDSEGIPRGFTANSFTSVSLDPPLVLVCVDKTASCYPAFAGTKHFGINILCEDQQHLSTAFASKSADKFADLPWVSGITGSPIFPDSTAWLDCELHDRVEVRSSDRHRKGAELRTLSRQATARLPSRKLYRVWTGRLTIRPQRRVFDMRANGVTGLIDPAEPLHGFDHFR